MKGFPNQIADFKKLSKGLAVALDLGLKGKNAKDNGVYGEALVRDGVAGAGREGLSVNEYFAQQALKSPGDRGHFTAARGLRELYRSLGLIDDQGKDLVVTPLGVQAASFAGQPLGPSQITFWRTTLGKLERTDPSGTSHPYQVLLRLVGRRPGIGRAKCALALEARDDSHTELDRIAVLSDLNEAAILAKLKVSKSNWDNAKKMLPSFAEQLGDVIKIKGGYVLAKAPGFVAPTQNGGVSSPALATPPATAKTRKVTAQTIAQAGIADRDEPPVPPDLDPAAVAAAIAARLDRLKRHNLMVRALAHHFEKGGYALYEDPFDILAVRGKVAFLVEAKTLDGTAADERDRVRDAMSQLLYYEAFATTPLEDGVAVTRIACFGHRPSDAHIGWLKAQAINTIWENGGKFEAEGFQANWLG